MLFLYTMRDFDNFKEPLGNAIRKVEERIGAKLFVIGDMIWWSPQPDDFPWPDWQVRGSRFFFFVYIGKISPGRTGRCVCPLPWVSL